MPFSDQLMMKFDDAKSTKFSFSIKITFPNQKRNEINQVRDEIHEIGRTG